MKFGKKYKKQKIDKNEKELPEVLFESLEDGFHKNIIQVFKDISKPFDNGKGEKEKVILDLLKPFNAVYEEDIGIIVPSTKETKVVVVSHIDLISTFNKGFAKDKVFSLAVDDKGIIISGALDNTITNAVVILALLRLKEEGKGEHIEFLFTEGEEIDLLGMKAYLKKYSNKPFFLNLDVTNDNQDKNVSLEYDKPSWKLSRQIKKLFKKEDISIGFTKERVGDDTDAVLAANGSGFSYCLPTFKTIHSYKNYTYVSNLEPYYRGLYAMLSELTFEEFDYDMKYSSFKKALKCKKKSEFEELETKAKKEYEDSRKHYSTPSYYKNYHGRMPDYSTHNKHNYDPWQREFEVLDNIPDSPGGRIFYDYSDGALTEEEMLIQLAKDYEVDDTEKRDFANLEYVEKYKYIVAALADYDIIVTPKLEKFMKENLYAHRQWTIDDLAYSIDSIDTACKVIEALDDYYIVKEIDSNSGVFMFS